MLEFGSQESEEFRKTSKTCRIKMRFSFLLNVVSVDAKMMRTIRLVQDCFG